MLRLSTRSFMQTRFQVRSIDVSKGYCLLVTDKNHTTVTFGFDNLDTQLQRLEQLLVHADDAKREMATVNLFVQRNIPVTYTKTATEVINETIDPEGDEPKILRAAPVNSGAKTDSLASAKRKATTSELKARRALPVERGRKN
jgi:hypothetical protein